MRNIYFIYCIIFLIFPACKKSEFRPKSKTDFIPIVSAISPSFVTSGNPIESIVKCGFYEHFADITFLNFEIKRTLPFHYDVRAKALYDNISYGISLPVVSTFDKKLRLPTTLTGNYILNFYANDQIVQTDTVQVN